MKRNQRSSRRTPLCLELLEDRCCPATPASAAPFDFGWADRAGSATNEDIGRAVATDDAGNVYVTGYFTGTADFGPRPGGAAILTSAGDTDVFVAKYSPTGNVLWVKDMGGSSSDNGRSIVVDSSGQVYVAGHFSLSAVFGAGEANATTLTAGGYDAFVAQLDPTSGNLVWVRQYGGAGFDYGNGLAVDATGNLYLTGDFTGDATLDGTTLTSSFRLFATRNGNQFQDGETFTIIDNDGTNFVRFEYDKNNSFTTGNFPILFTDLNGQQAILAATAQAINGANAGGKTSATAGVADWYVYVRGDISVAYTPLSTGIVSLSLSRGQSAFLAKLQSADGSVVWAQNLSGPAADDEHANGVAVNDAGVYVASQASHAQVNGSGYIWKFGLDGGAPVWMDQFFPIAQGITLDPSGNVLATGVFGGTRDFDPGPGTYNLRSMQNSSDIFVLKLDTGGRLVWAKAMGGSTTDYGMGVATDTAGNVYATGFFGGKVDFNPGSGTFSLTAQGTDIFVQKLSPAGAFLWAGAMGGPSTDQGLGIAVDGVGNVYTTGQFAATADFNPKSGQALLTSAGNQDIFVAKLTQPSALLAQGSAARKGANAATLTLQEVQPLLDQAIARWAAAGVDTSSLTGATIQIADLCGATLGMATGNTIWLDDNAAGWGWFVDATPWDDAEFTTPGDQGEQNRMDLLTVLEHELGHLLGFDHDATGVMADTLATGTRKTSWAGTASDGSALDWFFAMQETDSVGLKKRQR